MYSGNQHTRLMRGLNAIGPRDKVQLDIDLRILSAGYGLIPSSRTIAPYECTFDGMKANELKSWADMLRVPAVFREAVAAKYDLSVLLLGEYYLKACRLDPGVRFGGPAVAFCGSTIAAKVPRVANLRVIGLVEQHTRDFACGNVGLKGELGARLIGCLRSGLVTPSNTIDPTFNLLEILRNVR